MIFVADAIPTELKRVVEFLNEQMDPAEVLALELRQYVGENLKTLVPRVIGNTAGAVIKKGAGSPAKKQWDERSFFDSISAQEEPKVVGVVHALLDWAKRNCDTVSWGKGDKWGSFGAKVIAANGAEDTLFYVWSYGKTIFLEIPLGYFTSDCRLSELGVRQEFLKRLNEIRGINLPPQSVDKRRSFPVKVLAEGTALGDFLAVLDWAIAQTERGTEEALSAATPPGTELE